MQGRDKIEVYFGVKFTTEMFTFLQGKISFNEGLESMKCSHGCDWNSTMKITAYFLQFF